MGRWHCLSPWSCPEASYDECVTLTSLGKSLLHLFTLPTWHGCYQASPPSVAALGWVSALESQMVEDLLGWLVGLPGTLGSGWACSALLGFMAARCCSEIHKQTGSQATSSLLGLVPRPYRPVGPEGKGRPRIHKAASWQRWQGNSGSHCQDELPNPGHRFVQLGQPF